MAIGAAQGARAPWVLTLSTWGCQYSSWTSRARQAALPCSRATNVGAEKWSSLSPNSLVSRDSSVLPTRW